MSNDPFKSSQKQARTDEAFKGIQATEKSARDAKSARLRESRLKQEVEDKPAPPKKNARKAKPK